MKRASYKTPALIDITASSFFIIITLNSSHSYIILIHLCYYIGILCSKYVIMCDMLLYIIDTYSKTSKAFITLLIDIFNKILISFELSN